MLDLLFGQPGRRASSGDSRDVMKWLLEVGARTFRTRSNVSVDEDVALTYSAVWCATRVLAETLASLPLITYHRTKGDDREHATEHTLYEICKTAPNPQMGSMPFREGRTHHQVNWGNAFSEIEWDSMIPERRTQVVALHPIHPARVWPVNSTVKEYDQGYRYQVRNNDGSSVLMRPDEMLHVPGVLSEDGIWGKGVIAHARESVGFGIATERFGASFFGSGGQPKGVLNLPGMKDPEARRSFRSEWKEVHGSPEAGEVAILPVEGKYTQLSLTNEDSQFLGTRKFNVNEIARWYRIPAHMLGDLERATHCLPADQLVLTEGGPKSIASIVPGERVWSRAVGETLCLSTVRAVAMSGQQRVLTIRTTNRTLRLTANHRVLARRRVLAPSDCGPSHRFTWVTEWVEAGRLKVGDTIVVLKKTQAAGKTQLSTGRECSEEFAEFCGLLIADGNVSKSKGKMAGAQIARGEHANYMGHYREVMQTEFHREIGGSQAGERHPMAKLNAANVEQIRVAIAAGESCPAIAVRFGVCRSTVQKIRSGKLWAFRPPRKKPVHLTEGERQTRFRSTVAGQELEALGLAGVAKTKRVPAWVFTLPESHRLAFLRGFLDGDGSCDKKGRLAFSSSNKLLLEDIRHLCMTCGIPVTNIGASEQRHGEIVAKNRKSPPGTQYTFTSSDPGSNRRIWSHDARYTERLLAGKPFGRKGRKYPRYGGEGWHSEQCELSRINSISESETPEPVYDLQVDGTESFIANGVVVHNSNIEHQGIEFIIYSLFPWAKRWEEQLNLKLLLPHERRDYYVEHLFAALLRGDLESRYRAYQVAIQYGWLTINEARRLENMNGIGPAGDVHYIPLNMTTAERMMKGDPPPAAQRVPQQSEEEMKALTLSPPAHALPVLTVDVIRPVLRDVLARMLTKEANAAKRKANDPNFEEWLAEFHRDYQPMLTVALTPAAGLLQHFGGRAEHIADFVLEDSRSRFRRHYETDTRQQFAARLETWATRADGLTEEILYPFFGQGS